MDGYRVPILSVTYSYHIPFNKIPKNHFSDAVYKKQVMGQNEIDDSNVYPVWNSLLGKSKKRFSGISQKKNLKQNVYIAK